MIIDDLTYQLSSDNYIQRETIKKQIVIGHTHNHDMRHVHGWSHRYNGKYKKTASFTISKEGNIYQHFPPKYKSNFFTNPLLNNRAIVILLENDGWLLKDVMKNEFITWVGDIYKQSDEIVIKKWRGHTHWSAYTDKQQQSVDELVKFLCDEFSIPLTTINHNTKVDNVNECESIIYKSNLDKNYTDLSPAWDFEGFKNKIEVIIPTE
jgi:N-acetyl-anhydromuramyl-L-alanine amidase AmpD